MFKEITDKVTNLRETLLKVGLKPTAIAFKKSRIESADEKEQRACSIWLDNFKNEYVGALEEALKHVPALTMNLYALSRVSYQTFEETEVRLATKKLIDAWKLRPAILQRKKIDEPVPRNKKSVRQAKRTRTGGDSKQ